MFTIGEFAKIALVSKRLLDHYDEIGLLPPIKIEPSTGYRFYSAKQLPQLNRILALKDLGLSLHQIQKMKADNVSDEEIKGMLMLKKAEVEKTIVDEMARLRRVEARLRHNRDTEEPFDVVIKSTPKLHYLAACIPYTADQKTYTKIDQIICQVPAYVKKADLGQFLSLFKIHEPLVQEGFPYFGYLLKRPLQSSIRIESGIELRTQPLPPVGKMATCVQAIGEDRSFIVLGKIIKWIEANGYRVNGPCREISYDLTSFEDCFSATVELQVPVESIRPSPT
ncbi:MAG: MerR family transcriptional regulator [Chloroflexota bacterium]